MSILFITFSSSQVHHHYTQQQHYDQNHRCWLSIFNTQASKQKEKELEQSQLNIKAIGSCSCRLHDDYCIKPWLPLQYQTMCGCVGIAVLRTSSIPPHNAALIPIADTNGTTKLAAARIPASRLPNVQACSPDMLICNVQVSLLRSTHHIWTIQYRIMAITNTTA